MKRILRLKAHLTEYAVRTAREEGWEALRNGQLLGVAAEAAFDVFLTVDQNIRYQQTLGTLPLAIIVIAFNRLDTLVRYLPETRAAIERTQRRELIGVSQS